MNINPARQFVQTPARGRQSFEYRHVVTFEETNLIGNVYFTRHISWQGRCREMFIKQHVPQLLEELSRDLRLVTLRVACEYFAEIYALEEIRVAMSLAYLRQHRIGLDFEFVKVGAGDISVARGFQEIGCMRLDANGLTPVSPPAPLAEALRPYQ